MNASLPAPRGGIGLGGELHELEHRAAFPQKRPSIPGRVSNGPSTTFAGYGVLDVIDAKGEVRQIAHNPLTGELGSKRRNSTLYLCLSGSVTQTLVAGTWFRLVVCHPWAVRGDGIVS